MVLVPVEITGKELETVSTSRRKAGKKVQLHDGLKAAFIPLYSRTASNDVHGHILHF